MSGPGRLLLLLFAVGLAVALVERIGEMAQEWKRSPAAVARKVGEGLLGIVVICAIYLAIVLAIRVPILRFIWTAFFTDGEP